MTETEGEMKGGLLEGDLDTYQTTLEEVLTWLLMAEDDLQGQDDVSDDVEEVKEQFHTHEVRRHVLLFSFWNSFVSSETVKKQKWIGLRRHIQEHQFYNKW